MRETLEDHIENLIISLHDSRAGVEREHHYKESALAFSQVTSEIWKGKCQEAEISGHKTGKIDLTLCIRKSPIG